MRLAHNNTEMTEQSVPFNLVLWLSEYPEDMDQANVFKRRLRSVDAEATPLRLVLA